MTATHGPAEIAKSVGEQLRRLRTDRDLTQDMLSARLQAAGMVAGSSAKTVSAWERGETPLPITALWYLAIAFGLEPGPLGRRLGLCGSPDVQTTYIEEGADILTQLQEFPPADVAILVSAFRTSVEIYRAGRLARVN